MTPEVDAFLFEEHLKVGALVDAVDLYRGILGGPDAPDLAEESFDGVWDFGWASTLDLSYEESLLKLARSSQGKEALRYFEMAIARDRAGEGPYVEFAEALESAGEPAEAFRILRRLLEVLHARREEPSAYVIGTARRLRRRLRGSQSTANLAGRDTSEDFCSYITPAFGIDGAVEEALGRLGHSRIVTLIGPGGIGKTRCAMEVAHIASASRLAPHLWVDAFGGSTAVLSPVLEPRLLDTDALVVIDGAEAVLNEVREGVKNLLSHSKRTAVLVTSREPLEIPGESRQMIAPLSESAADQLLVSAFERNGLSPAPPGERAKLVELAGGMPLALELIAVGARPDSSAGSLDDQLSPLLESCLTALSAEGRAAFYRASAFAAPFTKNQFGLVFGAAGLEEVCRKSLISSSGDRLLMLPPIRRFARTKSAEDSAVAGAQVARYFLEFALAEAAASNVRASELAARFAGDIDHLRASFAYFAANDPEAALELASAVCGALSFLGWHREVVQMFQISYRPGSPQRDEQLIGVGTAAKAVGELEYAVWAYETAEKAFRGADLPRNEGACALNSALVKMDMGDVHSAQDALDRAQACFERYQPIALAKDYAYAEMNLLKARARLGLHTSDLDSSEANGLKALKLARDSEDHHSCAVILNNLGDVFFLKGEVASAKFAYEENATEAAACDDTFLVGHSLLGLATVALRQSEASDALQAARGALEVFNDFGTRRESLFAVMAAGSGLALGERKVEAAKLISGAHAACARAGFAPNLCVFRCADHATSILRRDLGHELFDRVIQLSASLSEDELRRLALSLLGSPMSSPVITASLS